MKTKQILSVTAAVVMALAASMPSYAAELTPSSPGGQTEVTAQILDTEPGDVEYIITIPDVVDFGTLTQPADNTADSFKDVEYTVTATKITGLDPDTKQISVYVKDAAATVDGDQEFYIKNKSDSSKKFSYDVYDTTDLTNTSVSVNSNTMTSSAGYFLKGFTAEGESVTGTLRLNQVQLCDYNIADIVGDYSGDMVFFSAVEDQ